MRGDQPRLKLHNEATLATGDEFPMNSWPNFREFVTGEVRRIHLPRTWVNKGMKRAGASIIEAPLPSSPLAAYFSVPAPKGSSVGQDRKPPESCLRLEQLH